MQHGKSICHAENITLVMFFFFACTTRFELPTSPQAIKGFSLRRSWHAKCD